MPLEDADKKGTPLNLKSTVLEEPEKINVHKFAAQQDITAEEYAQMLASTLKTVEYAKTLNAFEWTDCIKHFAELKIIYPDRDFTPNIPESGWQSSLQTLQELIANNNWHDVVRVLATTKILSPSRFAKINVNSEMVEGIKSLFDDYGTKLGSLADNVDVFWNIAYAKIALGDKFKYLYLDENFIANAAKGKLEHYKTYNRWWEFALISPNFRILFPEQYKQLSISPNCWDNIKDLLTQTAQGGNWDQFRMIASFLTIMDADKVIIGNDKVEIANNPKVEKPEGLPEVKKF